MSTALICLAAVILDTLLGEPQRAHPLVLFGALARRLESLLWGPARWRGVVAVALAVAPFVLAVAWLASFHVLEPFIDLCFLYLALGAKSLALHGGQVVAALRQGDLLLGRERVGWMVSRETSALDEEGVARAAAESVLENGNDALFAAMFWFILLGAPGVVLYRLLNTLDAMWGYRTDRYSAFGWAAARLDDLLNWVPARLTAFTYMLLGNTGRAWRCWRSQGPLTESPNAGVVMAAGAGALGLRLGGAAVYGGQVVDRAVLGEGQSPVAADIERAIGLVRVGMWLWVTVFLVGGGIVYG